MILLSMINEHLYNHLSQIIVGMISFFIGTIVAKKIRNNAQSSFINLFLFGIVIFIVKTLSSLKNISWLSDLAYGFLSISIIFVFVFIIKFFNKSIKRILVKLGEMSLESYLFNIFLIQAVNYWGNIFLGNQTFSYRLFLYLMIINLGIFLSFYCRKGINRLLNI